MKYGDLKGQRVQLDDGTILDVTGGFASNGSEWSDRKLFGDLAETGYGTWTRGYCIEKLLGPTPDDREHIYTVYRVCKGATEANEDDIWASVIAPTAHDAERLCQQVQGSDSHHWFSPMHQHPVWGWDGDEGHAYHVLLHQPDLEVVAP